MDDWRVLPSLTLNYGVRWEFFAPYTEKYDRLADVATNPGAGFTSETEQTSGENGLPSSLVFPWRKAFQPRVVLRGACPSSRAPCSAPASARTTPWASTPPLPPPWRTSRPSPTSRPTRKPPATRRPSACAQTGTCFTLANGFPAPATVGNYALIPTTACPM